MDVCPGGTLLDQEICHVLTGNDSISPLRWLCQNPIAPAGLRIKKHTRSYQGPVEIALLNQRLLNGLVTRPGQTRGRSQAVAMGECLNGSYQRQIQSRTRVDGCWQFAFQPRGLWLLPKIGRSGQVLPEGLEGPRAPEQRHQCPTLHRAHGPHRERPGNFHKPIVREGHLPSRTRKGNNGVSPLEGEFCGGKPNATACAHDQNVVHLEVKSARKNRT